MIGIKFPNEYRDKFEFEELRDKGVEPPSHWRLKDPSIDEFIRKPGVIDAFTALIFEAFTPEKMAPPQRVKDDTNSIKGEASLSVEERFAEIIVKGQNTDVLYVSMEIEASSLELYLISENLYHTYLSQCLLHVCHFSDKLRL